MNKVDYHRCDKHFHGRGGAVETKTNKGKIISKNGHCDICGALLKQTVTYSEGKKKITIIAVNSGTLPI